MSPSKLSVAVVIGFLAGAVLPASAQSTPAFGHIGIATGITIEPEGPVHSIDFDPALGGVAPVLTFGGGVFLTQNVVLDGDISIARTFSGDQRVRLGVIDFAATRAQHRDNLMSASLLGRLGPLWAGGGVVFARSLTERVGVASRQSSGVWISEPYANREVSSKYGVVGTVTARAAFIKSAGIVAAFRLYWFNHNERQEGLSARFVYRPTIGLDFRF